MKNCLIQTKLFYWRNYNLLFFFLTHPISFYKTFFTSKILFFLFPVSFAVYSFFFLFFWKILLNLCRHRKTYYLSDFILSSIRSDFNFGELAEAAYNYIVKYFMVIAQEDDNELMKLSKEDFRRILKNDQLNVKREEFVWEVILKWVNHFPVRQKSDLVYLLPSVRFGLMESKYFIDNVSWPYWIIIISLPV